MPHRILTARSAAAFAIGLAAMALPLAPAIPAAPELDESWRRCADGNADIAITGCTALIQSGGESGANLAAAFFNRGIAYRRKSHYRVSAFSEEMEVRAEDNARAIADYDQAILLDPNDADAHNNRGIAYDDARRYDRALQDFDRAIELKPGYAEALYNRGNTYRYKGQYDRANNQAVALDDTSHYDLAIRDYDQAIRLRPGYAEAYVARGVAYHDKGQYDRAIQDYDQALQLNPALAEGYNNRCIAYYKKGQYDRAQKDFDQTIRLQKNYGNLLVNRDNGAFETPARRRPRSA